MLVFDVLDVLDDVRETFTVLAAIRCILLKIFYGHVFGRF